MPFTIKVGIRRDTVPQLEQIAIFAARMGASTLSFSHVLPTSREFDEQMALGAEDRRAAELEIALLARIFKMRITIDAGYYNLDPAPPCSPLAGVSCNIDYRGHLSLCCNLSGFRGAVGEADVVADLKTEDFASAYTRLRRVADAQLKRRREALADQEARGVKPDLYLGSPCLFCLQSFDKLPWHKSQAAASEGRALPIVQ
jgi:MoaA/NifB/PqqE/SkfB family radical SAM enzyme